MLRRPAFLVLVAFLLLLVAGCAIGPDYKRPEMDIPQAFRFDEGQGSREVADSEWWQQFNDPVLEKLIVEALANNKTVKIAAANVDRASGILMTTRSAFFPQISYGGIGERARLSKNTIQAVPENPYNNFQAVGSASWEIDLWGRIRRLSESAKANLYATMEARRGVVLSL
ncbi:MAG: TolC family protein, partial [Syntrophorhabdus sp.]